MIKILPITFIKCIFIDIGSTSAEVLSMSNSFHKRKRKNILYQKMHPYILDILKLKCEINEIDLIN